MSWVMVRWKRSAALHCLPATAKQLVVKPRLAPKFAQRQPSIYRSSLFDVSRRSRDDLRGIRVFNDLSVPIRLQRCWIQHDAGSYSNAGKSQKSQTDLVECGLTGGFALQWSIFTNAFWHRIFEKTAAKDTIDVRSLAKNDAIAIVT